MEVQCEYSLADTVYQCRVTSISLTEPNTEIKFIGSHLPNKTDKDVYWLQIFSQTVKCFPKNLYKTFKNLRWLQVTRCKLEQISKPDLAGLEFLELVNLSANNLISLPDDLFAGTKNLREIYLSVNKLECLSSKLLKPLENVLEIVDFGSNVKISGCHVFDQSVAGNFEALLATIDKYCTPPERSKIDEEKQKLGRLDILSSHFEKFRLSGKYSDSTIKVHGKEFKVHKNILAAQSSVFDDMFSADTSDGTKSITNIKDFSEKSFKSFLNYFYTGRMDPDADAMETFELASEFDVAHLKTASIEIILGNLNDNAIKIFNLGKQHGSDELVQAAFKVLKDLYPDLVDALFDDTENLNEFVNAKQKIAAILNAKS